ncbi:MAG: phytanoyl-CoA dioxygenase family protein [Caulobacteraceae bacterium]
MVLKVFGKSEIGWCAATPPNETTDDDGRPLIREAGFSAADPRAPKRRVWDDPEVVALRERLRSSNGLPGLEIVAPEEIERARRLFQRDGFVVVKDLLDPGRLDAFRAASARVLEAILAIPGFDGRRYVTETNRLPHRYSYGTASASRQLLHEETWAQMIDLPTTTPILTALFGGEDYQVLGAGGDLCLPGAIEYQTLHSDNREPWTLSDGRLAKARALGIELRRDETGELTARTRQLVFERVAPRITINFLMSDQTSENGPIRTIPGTQARSGSPPTQAQEPDWMRFATIVGAPAGAGVFRDPRAWHGGTPNVSREIRAMPNVEYVAGWAEETVSPRVSMPFEIWERLSPHARRISERVHTAPGEWPAGAGVMHPLAAERSRAKEAAGAASPALERTGEY